jgi:lipopolysaccharide export system protein LptA
VPSRLVALLVLGALSTLVLAAAAQEPAERSDTEPYHLTADRLEGSATAGENVYTAIHPTVVHGTTTVTGDSALIYRNRELVLFRGNVKIVDGTTRMWGNEASYDRHTRLATLRGNVRIEEGTARITGREAQFFRAENRSVITGNPRLEDSTRTVTADRIEHDRTENVVTAIGRVDAVDRAESTRVRAGRVRYDRRRDYAWATVDPVLERLERGGRTTVVRSDTLEFDNPRRAAVALGNVRVEREKLRATGRRAEFYRSEDRAILIGDPRAWDEQGVVRGDSIEIRFAQNRVQSLRMWPNAVVEYEALADSARGERNIARGDTITVHFEEEEAREAVIVGHAESRYWPSAVDSAQGGRNVSTGDTIHVAFEGGEPARAVVRGKSHGIYYMAAEGDTSAAARREMVEYKGLEIRYDVNRGTVDVLGQADVAYREVNLTADRVTFDSQTDRMRAEGSPVLNDGNDRITGFAMTYDLNTRQGTVYEGRTTYERGFIHGERVRRVSENVLEVAEGTYSTCDLEEPHFHFGSTRMKVMIQDKVVARPVILYIKKIPVLALPFYVFPIKTGRHSGFQLPQFEFGSSTGGGKFVRNVGYYWAINDFMDASTWYDYYQQRSWVAHGEFRYHRRYGYQGNVSGSYENGFGTGFNRWDLIGQHYQTLGPGFALTARADMTNSSQYRRDQDLGSNVQRRTQRNLRSNLSLQKAWSGGAANLGLLQTQDLDAPPGGLETTRQLPSATLSLSARPLGRPARGKESARWPWLSSTIYSFRANALYERKDYATLNRADTIWADTGQTVVDTVLQVPIDSTDARGATRLDFSLSDTRSLLGFVRLQPVFTMNGIYYSRDQAGEEHQFGAVWRAGISANTAIYGTFAPGLGPLRALRHVITPTLSFAFQPEQQDLFYVDAAGVRRSRFQGVTGVSLVSGRQKLLGFSLRNDLHLKVGDPVRPRVINNLITMETSGFYDMLRVERPLSDISTRLNVKPIQRSDFGFSFVHNPYDLRLLQFGAATGIGFQGQNPYGEEGRSRYEEPGAQVQDANALTPEGLAPTALPWMVNVSAGYSGSRSRDALAPGGYSPWISSVTVRGAGALNLTKNWHLEYSGQFDAKTGRMISQAFTVKRELHCWEMQFVRSISGDVGDEYYFKINVKNLPEVYYEQGSRGLRGFGGAQQLY